MIWLLRLYPRRWRDRYAREVAEIVGSQPASFRLAIDLLAGAVDAHWKPQPIPRGDLPDGIENGEDDMMIDRLKNGCGTAELSTRDALVAAALTIGGSILMTAVMVAVDNRTFDTVALTMLPGVWLLAIQPFYLRGHSMAAKVVLIGGPLLLLCAISFAATLLNAG